MQGKGSRVQGSKVQRFKVLGSGLKVQGSGFRVQRFKVQGSKVQGASWVPSSSSKLFSCLQYRVRGRARFKNKVWENIDVIS
jgi:hypothetical protein